MVDCMQKAPVAAGHVPGVTREDVGAVAVLTLENAEGRCALTHPMVGDLLQHLDDVEDDDAIRAVVLTGSGRYFCTGTSLAGDRKLGEARDDRIFPERDIGGVLAIRLFDLAKPVVVALNGDAVGVGASMILPCDVRIAAVHARIGFVQARRGIALEGCASWFLPRAVGITTSVDWALSGRLVPAAEAVEAGLIRSLHGVDDLVPAAIAAATALTEFSAPVSSAVNRKMLWNSFTLASPMEAHRIETDVVRTLARQPDAREGVTAFFERRSAVFGGEPSVELRAFDRWWTRAPFEPESVTSPAALLHDDP
jgi:enoyl-CoA hydratase/carnithine racemase